FQMLELVIGSSAVSLGVLLSTFMGGMCLGSLILPRVVPKRIHPLRIWAILEAGIGVLGILVHFCLPGLPHGYIAFSSHGVPGLLLRGLLCALCLLPPTVLLGASFPALARCLDTSPQGVSRLGVFYSVNIAGGVVGSLLTGFWLLRLHDVAIASYFAATLNA